MGTSSDPDVLVDGVDGGQGDPLFVLGEALTAAEQELVDDAVVHLNGTVNRSGIELAAEVSAYILERFCDSSFEAFSDMNRYKARSFSALCERSDLLIKRATLYNLVRVGHQLSALPPPVAHRLSFKHHRALLPVDAPEEKLALAKQAADEGWSAATLERAVRGTQPPSNRGRRPLPGVVKQLRAVERALASDVPEPDEGLTDLSPEQRDEVQRILDGLQARIASMQEALAGGDA